MDPDTENEGFTTEVGIIFSKQNVCLLKTCNRELAILMASDFRIEDYAVSNSEGLFESVVRLFKRKAVEVLECSFRNGFGRCFAEKRRCVVDDIVKNSRIVEYRVRYCRRVA